jgi:hypothetical protein
MKEKLLLIAIIENCPRFTNLEKKDIIKRIKRIEKAKSGFNNSVYLTTAFYWIDTVEGIFFWLQVHNVIIGKKNNMQDIKC